MIFKDLDPEEELNEQRKAEHEAAKKDNSIVGAVEGTVDRLLWPLEHPKPSEEDREEQRKQTDEEERQGEHPGV